MSLIVFWIYYFGCCEFEYL